MNSKLSEIRERSISEGRKTSHSPSPPNSRIMEHVRLKLSQSKLKAQTVIFKSNDIKLKADGDFDLRHRTLDSKHLATIKLDNQIF